MLARMCALDSILGAVEASQDRTSIGVTLLHRPDMFEQGGESGRGSGDADREANGMHVTRMLRENAAQ